MKPLKFAVVGLINTALDFGVLNFFMVLTGITMGWYFSLFKAISFGVAVTNSYILNKRWTFRDNTPSSRKKIMWFVVISIGGGLINIGIASIIASLQITPFSPLLWANIATGIGICASLIWNFLGYKYMVFS